LVGELQDPRLGTDEDVSVKTLDDGPIEVVASALMLLGFDPFFDVADGGQDHPTTVDQGALQDASAQKKVPSDRRARHSKRLGPS
jgi:hypothetical protein